MRPGLGRLLTSSETVKLLPPSLRCCSFSFVTLSFWQPSLSLFFWRQFVVNELREIKINRTRGFDVFRCIHGSSLFLASLQGTVLDSFGCYYPNIRHVKKICHNPLLLFWSFASQSRAIVLLFILHVLSCWPAHRQQPVALYYLSWLFRICLAQSGCLVWMEMQKVAKCPIKSNYGNYHRNSHHSALWCSLIGLHY